MSVADAIQRFCQALANGLLWLAAGCLASFTLAVTVTVAGRYLMGVTPHWAEELPRLLLVWCVFLAAAASVYRDTHLRADLLAILPLSRRVRQAAESVGDVFVLGYLLIMIVAGWSLAMRTMAMATTALQLPAGLGYLPLPVGFALASLLLVAGRLGRGTATPDQKGKSI